MAGETKTDLSGTQQTPLDPDLEPLANNGSYTETHALGANSPAFNNGDCTDIDGNPVDEDQRGSDYYTRPQEYACDIGAFEAIDDPCHLSHVEVFESLDDSTPIFSVNSVRNAYSHGSFASGDVIKCRQNTNAGYLQCNEDVDFVISGGWNCDKTVHLGVSTIMPCRNVKSGTVSVQDMVLQADLNDFTPLEIGGDGAVIAENVIIQGY